MIRSGEGRRGGWPGRGREGEEEGGRGGGPACARAPASSPAARPRPAPLPPRPPRPRRLRPAERARPPRHRPRSPELPRRAPAAPPAPGGGARTLRPRGDPENSPPARPGRGLSPSSPGSAPAAHVRVFKLFFEGLACPPRRKMPTEAAAGGGEEAASAFQTSQEFRTLLPHSGCPCG